MRANLITASLLVALGACAAPPEEDPVDTSWYRRPGDPAPEAVAEATDEEPAAAELSDARVAEASMSDADEAPAFDETEASYAELDELLADDDPAPQPGLESEARASEAAAPVAAPAAAEKEQAPEEYRLSATELSIWNDPGFQRKFALSYRSETEIEPSVTLEEMEDMEKVGEYLADDRADKAEKLLLKNLDPASSAVFDFTLGNIYFQADKYDEAVLAYEMATEKFPNFRRAWKNLSLMHIREEKYDEAIEALTRSIELGANDGQTYGFLAVAYSKVGNHISSESAFRMAVLLDPLTRDWREGLALSFFHQKRYPEMISLVDTMIEESPDNGQLWMLRGNGYIGLKQPLKAAECFELLDGLGGSTPDTLNLLGDIYVNSELYDLGVDAYVRALEASDTSPLKRPMTAAKVLAAKGALEETRLLVDTIQELRGDELKPEEATEMLRLRARMARVSGETEEHVTTLEEIIALDPLDGDALIQLGQHQESIGNEEQAIFYFERAAAIEDFEADAKVRHAQLLARKKEYRQAIALLKKAQQLRPRDTVEAYLRQIEDLSKGR